MNSQFDLRSGEGSSSTFAGIIQAYVAALAMVAAATLTGLWIVPRWGTAAVDMIYLPAVLIAAALWGRGPGLTAGIVAALAYNYFFTEPLHTLRIDRFTDVVTVMVLLVVAIATSKLAAGIRSQARLAAAHASRNATIAGFAGRLLSCSTEHDISATACDELSQLFDCNAMLVSGVPQPRPIASVPEGTRLTPSDIAAAALTIESGEPAGRGTPRMQPAEWVFYPVRTNGAVIAAAGLARDDGTPMVEGSQLALLRNLLDQVSLAMQRARLEGEAWEFAATRERDRLRSALLASIGRDVTPRLATIARTIDELRRGGTDNKALLSAVASEALKVERYISDLVKLGPESDQQPIECGGVTIDLFQRAVFRNGEEVHLTPKEYAVLAELAKHRGRVLAHAHLLRAVWGPAQERQIEYLRVAIRALRQKLEADASQPRLIINEPAVGYRLAMP